MDCLCCADKHAKSNYFIACIVKRCTSTGTLMKTQVELLSRGERTQEYLLLNGLSLVYKILFANISLHLNSSDQDSCQKLSLPII